MYDEPLAVPESARGHYATCADCQGRFTGIADDARQMTGALAVPAATVDAAAAHKSVTGRLEPRKRFVLQLPRLSSNRARRTGLVALVAASLALLAVVSPLAQDVVNVFEPQQVQQVTLTQASLAGFPDLSHWGTVAVTQQPELKQVDSAKAAQDGTGLPLMHAGRIATPEMAERALAGAPLTGLLGPLLPVGVLLQLAVGALGGLALFGLERASERAGVTVAARRRHPRRGAAGAHPSPAPHRYARPLPGQAFGIRGPPLGA